MPDDPLRVQIKQLIATWKRYNAEDDTDEFGLERCSVREDCIEDLEDLLPAAPVEAPPLGWQPIETLPKDGTGFLVYWPVSLVGGPEVDRLGGWQEYSEIVGSGLVSRLWPKCTMCLLGQDGQAYA